LDAIQSFRHRGLRRLFEDDDPRGVKAEHLGKLGRIPSALDAADGIGDMNLPGFDLHPPKGDFKGFWAVAVRANSRAIFRIVESDVCDVDCLDYR
jgi:proteic killer suppression protein